MQIEKGDFVQIRNWKERGLDEDSGEVWFVGEDPFTKEDVATIYVAGIDDKAVSIPLEDLEVLQKGKTD